MKNKVLDKEEKIRQQIIYMMPKIKKFAGECKKMCSPEEKSKPIIFKNK